ncbi:murein transglycosylase A [Loktanella agnita]|uniref:murein transglycosylase A n=1 Tax=Loktanella agnita TaxID=287097 RepID=UPI003987ADBD
MSGASYRLLSFDDLNGWAADNHQAALDVFLTSSDQLSDPVWADVCMAARTTHTARAFFETQFLPVLVEDGTPMLFTGYFEPELKGARQQSDAYPYPIYAVPDDLTPDRPYLTRRQIEEGRPLAGKGLEIAWLADPVDVFFLQVQGSGRIRMSDGSPTRVGFAAKNGHPYQSVGKMLIARGIMTPAEVSADMIRAWVSDNPDQGRALLWENESYVFFSEINDLPDSHGPIGAMGRPVSAGRSIAVDPDFTPLGAPVWIEKLGNAPLSRLMIAQDTGSAIKGAQRADIFFGTGDQAGQQAGQINDPGRMILLLPKALAHQIVTKS